MASRDTDAIRRRCTRSLAFGRPSPAAALAALADYAGKIGAEADQYIEGRLADEVEARTAALLGKPAALWVPTGTMAQLLVLRILADRAGCRRIAMHPRAHFEEHEQRAYQELYGLTAAALGGPDRLPRPADLDAIAEALGAVTIEMPLRRLGLLLMPWDDLAALAARARARGVALHLDGARLWESAPFYGRPLAEIAGLFDTVYVAFDKGLGALGGCAVAGPADIIAEARLWRHRAGGRILRSFPYLIGALKGLEEELPRMAALHETAGALARQLAAIPGIRVTPDPPHANAMLVALPGDPAQAMAAALDAAEETGIWLFDRTVDCAVHGMVTFEATIRAAALAVDMAEIAAAIACFAERLAARSRGG